MIAPPVNEETIPPVTSSGRDSPPKRSTKSACEIEDAIMPESVEKTYDVSGYWILRGKMRSGRHRGSIGSNKTLCLTGTYCRQDPHEAGICRTME
jgi:hypothetical protein